MINLITVAELYVLGFGMMAFSLVGMGVFRYIYRIVTSTADAQVENREVTEGIIKEEKSS